MRCLRCAIDYPSDAQYCDRCGRALSRPPGSKKPVARVEDPAEEQSRFMYSTFAPPPAERSRAQPIPALISKPSPAPAYPHADTAVAPSRQRELPRSVYLARPAAHEATRAVRQPATRQMPEVPTNPGQPGVADSASISIAPKLGTAEVRARSHPVANRLSDAPDTSTLPKASETAASQPIANRRLADRAALSPDPAHDSKSRLRARLEAPTPTTGRVVSGAFPDEAQSDAATVARAPVPQKLKPTAIDTDPAIWRRPAPGRKRGPVTPGRIAATIVIVLACAGGAAGYNRYSAYSNDVKAGQSLFSAGKYSLAVLKFHQAIGEWPLHSDAESGLTASESAISSLTQRKHSQLDVGTIRANMIMAHSVARLTAAAQVDTSAAANPSAT
jgi:hypothetical protein